MVYSSYEGSTELLSHSYSRPAYSNLDITHTDNDQDERLTALRKSVREQNIILSTFENTSSQDDGGSITIEAFKSRILAVSRELQEKSNPNASAGQLWARYQLNLRQLEDIADERRSLKNELDYLIKTSLKDTSAQLLAETETLNRAKLELARQKSGKQPTIRLDEDPNREISEADRIRLKAQAMVAARLNRNGGSTNHKDSETIHQEEIECQARLAHVNRLQQRAEDVKNDVSLILQEDLSKIDTTIRESQKCLRDRQMFEQGFYLSDDVARFIDSLDKLAKKPDSSLRYNISTRSASAPAFIVPTIITPKDDENPTPPPIPTSQRPGSPRSALDVKAEAQKRIQQRRQLILGPSSNYSEDPRPSSRSGENTISEDEKAAQQRLRQAEIDARERLDSMREKRQRQRQEAAEAEQKRKKAAEEAKAEAEARMIAERKRLKQEEEERQEKEKRAKEELAERIEQERLREIERKRQEEEEIREREAARKRDEEEKAAREARQQKARLAAQQAAKEKRVRQEEIERREREIEAAREEELKRRREWEEAEQKRRQEEQAALEEEEQRKREEQERKALEQKADDEARYKRDLRRKEREEAEKRKKMEAERLAALERARVEAEEDSKRKEAQRKEREAEELAQKAWEEEETSETEDNTAGTSGYGVDIEDEVDFGTIYRVKTLYEYRGVREGDLSFSEDEILKAHPSKDSASDWWYGTSLLTNAVGFFPRTYVEVIEEAFRARALYGFTKEREDDLGFQENDIIVVQPFQDEASDWWYGTNEDTKESGYFPKTYVETIAPASKKSTIHASSPIPINNVITASKSADKPHFYRSDSGGFLTSSDSNLPRGTSAPNTPIFKKSNVSLSKTEFYRRRRAASNASMASIGTPTVCFPPISQPEFAPISTWASTMEQHELEAIPQEERARQEAIYELITTERGYLRDLQMIINASVFYADSGKYLTQEEQDVVFSNIDDLLLCNTALFSDLETRQREGGGVVGNVGDVFLKHAESLKCYSTYCRNQSFASRFLQKKREEDQWFEVFLKTARTRTECRSLDLSHFLLEPMQRITRYPLLLRQILKSTPKKHPDYGLMRSALVEAEKVLEVVNEETRRYENRQKIDELSRILDMEGYGRLDVWGREFVMEGILYKAKSGRKLHAYLFNDILILAEPLKSLSPKGYLYSLYREPMNIENVSIRQQQNMTLKPSFGGNSDDTSFQIVYGTSVIAVKTSASSQKRQWISQVQHYSALQTTMNRQ
ncbi:hypothetical protein J3Q64DRAFT_1664753 [Phycomyces blakesleeanus]|uniref:Uncharacterized protein n=1 Tax=Phycomyces blakesleeanus TaxID=4837 RepID=A0ABR3APW3_PHYBL